ncbi:MAG: sigma-70 family RNA polymerase sigma factor [candidate division Zixibacteria bacterium]|nr:sigma-70 family RNA polymerase sigma factor [candidate division Zixibacteria bacterium]
MQETNVLIKQTLAGDPKAFEAIVNGHKRLVGQIVARLVKNEEDRIDLSQDTFIKVYQNLVSFQGHCKLSTWIAKIAYNTSLNYLEKKRTPLYSDHAAEGKTVDDCQGTLSCPEQYTGSRQLSVRLCEEIDQLPLFHGTVISLYHFHDMTYKDIGDILQLPEGTVKSYLFRGRKMLKDRLVIRFNREELCA